MQREEDKQVACQKVLWRRRDLVGYKKRLSLHED
jgi:hypothetical protein